MEPIKRIPRPLNSTHLARMYREDNTDQNKAKLRNLIIKAFISNQYYICTHIRPNLYLKPTPQKNTIKKSITKDKKTKDRGIYTNAPNDNQVVYNEVSPGSLVDLANFIGLTEAKTRQKVMVILKKKAEVSMSNDMEQEAMSGIARATILGTFFRAQQQGLIQSEWGTELRTVARLNGYHPLQVKEANSAMANEAQLANQIFNMATKIALGLKPAAGTQINIQQNNQPTTNQQFLTPTMAVQLIEERGYNAIPASGTELLQQLATEHSIGHMPDVKAIGADAQGIMAPKVQDLVYIKHDDRREEELGVLDHTIS